jgi:hypothetical protein
MEHRFNTRRRYPRSHALKRVARLTLANPSSPLARRFQSRVVYSLFSQLRSNFILKIPEDKRTKTVSAGNH